MNAQSNKHELEDINVIGSKQKYKCKVCQQEWVNRPRGDCPGVKVFLTRDPKVCPEQYKTLAELKAKNLRPKKADLPSAAFRPYHQGASEFLYDETKAIPIKLSDTPLKGLKLGFKVLVWLANATAGAIVVVLLGLNPAPTSIPVIDFVLQHQLLSLISTCIVMLLIIIGFLIFIRLTSNDSQWILRRFIHPWSVVTSVSTVSFLFSSTLLVIILLRPSWCPASLCPQLTNPQGVHDTNLDAYFFTFEGNAVVIPGNPVLASATEISNEKNPPIVHAVLLKDGYVSSPTYYRIVLVVHSLYQGRYSILIDRVALVVDNLPIIPKPLNVWVRKPNVSYDVSRYGIVYHGETRGSILFAKYLQSANGGLTQLAASESDQLDVQISSIVPVDLKFKMKISYHIATMFETYTLTLPGTFEVVFSDKSNWHEYQPHAGHFVANL